VDRYQSSHSFVWKYGTSLLDLIDVDSLVALASSPSDLQGSSSCAGPAPTALRALDLGCGTGHLTKQLRDKIFASANAGSDGVCRDVQVLGMDLDPAMIESAKSSFPSIDFFVGDARSFRLKDRHKLLEASPPSPPKSSSSAQVHLILSNAALHWVPPRDVDRAVESISRTLVPGGQFVAEFGGKGNVGAIVRALQRVFPPAAPSSAPDFWYYPSIAGFSTVLERHGIEVTSASLYDRPTPLEDGDDGMKNWIKMFGSKFWEHYRDLSEDQLEAKIDEAVELLRPDLYDPATRQWTADYRRIRVVGRKL
jgi:trans-aconitate 2-methyltransferase